MSKDWLDTPPALPVTREELSEKTMRASAQQVFARAIMDDTSPPSKEKGDLRKIDPEYAAVVVALRRLRPIQRTYIRAFLEAKTKTEALRIMAKRGVSLNPATVFRWQRTPEFNDALNKTKHLVLRLADIDPVSLQLRAGKVLDDAMEPAPVYNRDGDIVGYETNGNIAMRAIEWLGKVNRMTEDASVRVQLEMINLTGVEDPVEDAIDVTPEHVR